MQQRNTPRFDPGARLGVAGHRARGIVALAATLSLTACGSDSSPTASGAGVISASMNGAEWSVSSAVAQHNAGANLLVIFAPSTESFGLGVNIPGFQGTGSHAFGPATQTLAVVTNGQFDLPVVAVGGS